MNNVTKFSSLPQLSGLVLLIGPPSSGKSTFAQKLISLHVLASDSYISNDKITQELFSVTVDRGDKDGAIFPNKIDA